MPAKKATPEMLAEVEASGGRKAIRITATGGMEVCEVSQESVDRRVKREVEEQIAEADLSRAQRRMRARREKMPDLIQPIEITTSDGESNVWFAKTLSDADITTMGFVMATEGFAMGATTDDESMHVQNAALLYVGLVVSETDETRFFESYDEAKEFYRDPRWGEVVTPLRGFLIERNLVLGLSKKKGTEMRLLPATSLR